MVVVVDDIPSWIREAIAREVDRYSIFLSICLSVVWFLGWDGLGWGGTVEPVGCLCLPFGSVARVPGSVKGLLACNLASVRVRASPRVKARVRARARPRARADRPGQLA